MASPSAVETDDARDIENQFRSLMEGLRTTLPGVQVLFGFLLALPFQADFAELTRLDRWLYYLAFVATGAASVLLIAPSAHQRIRAFRTGIARRSLSHVHTANRLATAGTAVFMVALAAAVYVVSRIVFADVVAAVAAAGIVALAGWTWFYQPLVRLERDP